MLFSPSAEPNYHSSMVSFIRRQANFVVHILARKASCFASDQVFNYVLNCIFQVIINDMI